MKDIDPNTPEILFIESLENMLKSVGISRIYEAMDYWKLMKESVYRDVFNRQNPNNSEKYKEHKGRQAFIKIFQFRYKQTYDIDYDIPISDRDAHSIGLILKDLDDLKIPIDSYLEWYFEDYLVKKNSKVESIVYPCKKWVLQSFRLNNKDTMEDIQKKQLEEKERITLFVRSRAIIRDSKFVKRELADEVIDTLKRYNNNEFELDELRSKVAGFEDTLRKAKTKI
jgi:glutathione peroxidase-family protein